MSVNIVYALSQVGQRASLKASGNGKRLQSVVVSHGDDWYEQAVELAHIKADGTGELNLSVWTVLPPDGVGRNPEFDRPMSATELLEWETKRREWVQERDHKAAEQQKVEDRRQADELLAGGAESLLYFNGQRWTTSRQADNLKHLLGELFTKATQMAEAKTAAHKAEMEAEAEQKERWKEQVKERTKAEIKAWAEQHGSSRLKRCVREGIECKAVYRDERIAKEFPGWEVDTSALPSWEEARNPPVEALELLDKARATLPANWTDDERREAILKYWEKDDEDGDKQTGYAVVVDPGPWCQNELAFGYDGPRDEDD